MILRFRKGKRGKASLAWCKIYCFPPCTQKLKVQAMVEGKQCSVTRGTSGRNDSHVKFKGTLVWRVAYCRSLQLRRYLELQKAKNTTAWESWRHTPIYYQQFKQIQQISVTPAILYKTIVLQEKVYRKKTAREQFTSRSIVFGHCIAFRIFFNISEYFETASGWSHNLLSCHRYFLLRRT